MKWSEFGIIFALILFNGFFAASELALVSARKARLKMRADRGEVGARMALQLLADPTKLLSSVQIGITLVGILTGVYSGAVFAEDLAVVLRKVPSIVEYADEIAFGVVVVCVT
jgi:putative hemolysin